MSSLVPLHLRSLFDFWNLQNFCVMGVLKTLQFFRWLGVRPESAGWRKVAGIFVRNESSKFMLAGFRLDYRNGTAVTGNEARTLFVKRLGSFLREHSELYWTVRPGKLFSRRRKIHRIDLMEAYTDPSGQLIRIVPHFDEREPVRYFSKEQISFLLGEIVTIHSAMRYVPGKVRQKKTWDLLQRWTRQYSGHNYRVRFRVNSLIDRIMSSVFLYYEMIRPGENRSLSSRFRSPDLREFRHPGWGMLCLSARFAPDWSEADLWWQVHHVITDGAPMQETLNALKKEWGTVGPVVYPPLKGRVSTPDISYCGDHLFRARLYIDFSQVLAIRKTFNSKYQSRINGKASIASMLVWGFSAHPFLAGKKMLIPVDAGVRNGERQLGLLVIRPDKFRHSDGPGISGFLAFQKEFNQKLAALREGHGESDEFLQLCTLLHPFFYHAAGHLMASSLQEILGTIGFSVIRDAEMFISPFTDFQTDGFLSLGNVSIPTEDGRKAGSLCICGGKKEVRQHIEAIRGFFLQPDTFFQS